MAVKTIILLAAFHEKYPNIRKEISAFLVDFPEETELREFLFDLLTELQSK